MPMLIVTSRYLKKGAVKKKSQNYVKYIATREGSVPVKENSGNEPQKMKKAYFIGFQLCEKPTK
ncbi:Uncharacterised protein [uncultured Ruminococcus sp.]|jgi:hypothetical protein|uniref:Uncharacterized protein n=1 Tax=Hominimerdicola aceti TaxID=2981726 RepID=A0AAE3IEF0_9FIRM|nr:hypothetical protein [Hominimerdicola aceti]MCU6704738.1 hypothetical protein [Hominimerdicola aceti]SCI30298.1 Uncharacterised protein [uncultured Ruminococcus sp.]